MYLLLSKNNPYLEELNKSPQDQNFQKDFEGMEIDLKNRFKRKNIDLKDNFMTKNFSDNNSDEGDTSNDDSLSLISSKLKTSHIGINEEEIERKKKNLPKRVSIANDDYINAVMNVKAKIYEELKFNNISLKQMKILNRNLKNDIHKTNLSLNEANEENKMLIQSRNTKNIFLSSKGLKTIPVKRNKVKIKESFSNNINHKIHNDKIMLIHNNNNINNSYNNEENKEKAIQRKEKKETLTEIVKREIYEKKKSERLKNVYYKLLKGHLLSNEKEAENYIKLYSNKKIPSVDYNYGSNIHGLFQDFQKKSQNINLSYKADLINNTKRYIFNRKISNSVDFDNNGLFNFQNHLYDIDKLKDEESQIENLPYKYCYDILSEPNKNF